MKLKLTLLSIIIIALFIGNVLQSQDFSDPRWSNSPSTRLYLQGNSNLPTTEKYVQRNMTTRLYHTPMGNFLIPPNIRPYPSTVTQSEVAAVTMTGNQNVMWAAWNSFGPSFYGTGFCVTTNGGTNWIGNYQMPVGSNSGDPGPWVWSSNSSWPGRLALAVIGASGMSTTYSTDYGVTWQLYSPVGGNSVDKEFSCSDDVTGSPFLGRAYTVWTDFGGTYVNRIVGAYTTNGGANWVGYGPIAPAPVSGHHCQGCDVCVGPGGVVYAIWANCLTNGQNSTEDSLGFAKSTDGGVTWTASTNHAVNLNGIRAQSFYNGFRVNCFPRIAVDKSGGARNGWIYVTGCEKFVAPARDTADVTLCRSTDGGTTWTHSLVNGDAAGNYQWFSSVGVDQSTGNVAIGYYDTRGQVPAYAQYYVSWSNNGGSNWVDVQASDHTFVPAPIPGLAGGYQGDYTGMTYSNGKFYPFWMDNSSGIYQVWTVGITPLLNAHDIQCGPFLSLPTVFYINSAYAIKTKVTNIGTNNETAVPVKFYINGVLVNTTNINLTAGQADSVSNSWTPTSPGGYTLKYISSLSTDTNRTNDTVITNITVFSSAGPLCEGFNSTTFPPSGWNVVYTGTNYWSRCTCSGYNLGSGSAMYDCWNAPNGTNQDLITLTFAPIYSPDSLKFLLSYCPFGTTDSLIILASTNGGTTYTAVARYGGTSMGTVTSCTHPFTPTIASDWVMKKIAMPVGTNKIDFLGKSGYGDSFFIDSICAPMDDVVVNNKDGMLKAYSLSQNYPNPFNPTTNIEYALLKPGLVKLVVYDVLGAEVAVLVNQYKNAGRYFVSFNAENVASGIYFYKITSGDFTAVKKMLIIK